MFGYVTVNEPELKIRELETYRSYYCGLCQSLKDGYGTKGRLAVNYDLTMVYLLLTSLYEPKNTLLSNICRFHCCKKVKITENLMAEYAGDMSILLTYGKACDDWQDEKKLSGRIYSSMLKNSVEKLKEKYPEKTAKIFEGLEKIHCLEDAKENNLDVISGAFGEIFGEICCWRQDEWAETLREFGFYLGKFIYLCDAYEDLENDEKKGCYNPLLTRSKDPCFEDDIFEILTMIMTRCAEAFEFLPLIEDVEILRNIIYSGVWGRYNAVKDKRFPKNPESSDNGERAENKEVTK